MKEEIFPVVHMQLPSLLRLRIVAVSLQVLQSLFQAWGPMNKQPGSSVRFQGGRYYAIASQKIAEKSALSKHRPRAIAGWSTTRSSRFNSP